MHTLVFVEENETHKHFCDFEIQTDHLISARRPDIKITTKKKEETCGIMDFAVPANYKVKLKIKAKSISALSLLGN